MNNQVGKANDRKRQVIILIDQEPAPPIVQSLKALISSQIADKVSVIAAKGVKSPQLHDAVLVVVCGKHLDGIVRSADVPIIVCEPSALYEVGMTLGSINRDFGETLESPQIESSKDLKRPFITLATPTKTQQLRGVVGWGRSAMPCLSIARLSDEPRKQIAFAFDVGDAMPGLVAPHRRVAWLFAESNGATPDWVQRLFDTVLHWSVFGGPTPAYERAVAELEAAGQPTQVMSIQEYRTWVHSEVSGTLLKWIVGGLALATLIVSLFVGFVTKWTTTSATNALDVATTKLNETDALINSKVKEQLDGRLAKDIKNQVGNMLVTTRLGVELNRRAELKVEELTETIAISASERLEAQLAEALSDKSISERVDRAFNATDGPLAKLNRELMLNDKVDVSIRQQALLQLIYLPMPQLRTDLLQLLRGIEEQETTLLGIVLRNYRPESPIDATDESVLVEVIKHLTSPSERIGAMREDFTYFFNQFPNESAQMLARWLRQNASSEVVNRPSTMTSSLHENVLYILAGLPGALIIKELVVLATSDQMNIQQLGKRGLAKIAADRELSEDVRLQAVKDLISHLRVDDYNEFWYRCGRWYDVRFRGGPYISQQRSIYFSVTPEVANSAASAPWSVEMDCLVPEVDWSRLLAPTDRIYYYYDDSMLESSAYLARLLRPVDWPMIKAEWGNEMRDPFQRAFLDVILRAWVRMLQESTTDVAKQQELRKELFEQTKTLPDCLYGFGTSQALESGLVKGTDEEVAAFVQNIAHLYTIGGNERYTRNGFNWNRPLMPFRGEVILEVLHKRYSGKLPPVVAASLLKAAKDGVNAPADPRLLSMYARLLVAMQADPTRDELIQLIVQMGLNKQEYHCAALIAIKGFQHSSDDSILLNRVSFLIRQFDNLQEEQLLFPYSWQFGSPQTAQQPTSGQQIASEILEALSSSTFVPADPQALLDAIHGKVESLNGPDKQRAKTLILGVLARRGDLRAFELLPQIDGAESLRFSELALQSLANTVAMSDSGMPAPAIVGASAEPAAIKAKWQDYWKSLSPKKQSIQPAIFNQMRFPGSYPAYDPENNPYLYHGTEPRF